MRLGLILIIAALIAVVSEAPSTDLERGKALCASLCLTCHSIHGEGVGFAPPLDGSAKRDISTLIAAVVDPNQAVESVFRAYRIETKSGAVFEGLKTGQDAQAITLTHIGGVEQEVPLADIARAGYVDGKSTMLDAFGQLGDAELIDLIHYLRSVE